MFFSISPERFLSLSYSFLSVLFCFSSSFNSFSRFFKFVLEVSGFVCYTAFNGEDGLKLAKEIIPDLIILDVMMPKINGYKISRLLKYDAKYKDIPIIMVTARSQLEDKMIGEETGVNEYITKPFELDQIVKKVEEYLGKNEGVNG